MSNLVKYEAACRAISECKRVDEVKSWHDKAAAMQAYGRMAKDKTLEIDAAEIRIRAERRLGELITAQKATVGLNKGGRPPETAPPKVAVNPPAQETPQEKVGVNPPTLAEAGIDHNLSSRAQKIAAVPEAEFEAEVGEWRGRVQEEGARVTARLELAGEREMNKPVPAAAPVATPAPETEDDFAPSEDELRQTELEDRAAREMFDKLLASDDKLADAVAENKRLNSELAKVKVARDGYMNRCNELIRSLKSAQSKIDKIQRGAK